MNFLIYWDGDLEREMLSGTGITKMVSTSKVEQIFNADGCESNNSTKAVPCMTADLFGDWREEVILRTSDNKHLRVWCTTAPTQYRLTTLMHDPQYRMQNCCQQSAYNQPPHASFYLGSDQPLPERPNVKVLGAENPPAVQPTEPVTEAPTEPPTEPAKTLDEPENPEDFIYGDVNFDGVVDIFDMALVKKHLVQPVFGRNALRRADVDADGLVGVVDAAALQRYLSTGKYMPAYEQKLGFTYAIDQQINKAANGSKNNRSMKIEIVGSEDYRVLDCPTTEVWTTWQERGIVLPLKAGKNTIRLTSATAEGGPNFDYLRTEWTDEPVPEVWTEPVQQEAQPVQNVAGRTVWIAGDSTVQTYNASKAPQQGWGAYLSANLPEGVKVENRAIAGRSSKSFYDNGRLTSILDSIQKDDYLLVQFGINDAGSSKPERYAPTCGQVPGTENSFEWYMQKYIEGAKAKGAKPVMVTTVIGLKAYSNGKFVGSYGNYCDSMKKLAAYYQIPVIDLNTLMVSHYNSIGYDAAYKYHMVSTGNGSTDMTHFTEAGARAVAKLVADDMKQQGLV